MELDFSKLEDISYRGFKDKAEKDKLTDQGYYIVDDPYTPFKTPPAQGDTNIPPAPERRENRPSDFQNTYGKMYRTAFNFHKEHFPPPVDQKYWSNHAAGQDELPGIELAYWEKTSTDIAEAANRNGNDPFLMGLLTAVMEDLGREYERRRRS